MTALATERGTQDAAAGADATVGPHVGGTRLYVTTSYPRFAGDCAGSFVQARVQAFVAGGGRARVLAAGAPTEHDAQVSGAALQVRRVKLAVAGAPPLFYEGGAPERLEAAPAAAWLQALRLWGGLTAALRASAVPGSIESHWLLPSAAAVCWTGPAGVPHTAYAHSGDVALLQRLPGGSTVARLLCQRGARLVFASEDLRARFAALVGAPLAATVATCPVEPAPSPLLSGPQPPVPAAERRALRVRLRLAGPVVLGVGRLVPIKGYDLLIRAVARLPVPPIVVLIGDGPERGRLAAMAVRRRVDLRLTGPLLHSEVRPWLTAADLFVHPARRIGVRTEGQPLAVREAMAAGLPVVASALGGLPELAGAGPGLVLVSPEDPVALARAIDRHVNETKP